MSWDPLAMPSASGGTSTPAPDPALTNAVATIAQKTITPVDNHMPVLGPVTNDQLRSEPLPVCGPVTNAQLRASPVSVSFDAFGLPGGKLPVVGPMTIDELRAAPIAVTLDGGATAAAQTAGNASLATLVQRLPAKGAAAGAAAMPVVLATDDASIGAKVTAVAALGAGGSGLIGWLSDISAGVKAATPPGTNSIGKISDITNPVQTLSKPATSGGLLTSKVLSAASANPALIKGSPGQVYGIHVSNSGLSTAYLRLFNKASAPVLGTDSPVEVIPIPAGTVREISRPMGVAFSNGIAVAITGGVLDLDLTAIGANTVVGAIHYA